MKMDKMDKLISIGKVATILNQTTKQLQRWDNDGTFVAIKSVAGTRYYNMDDVLSMKKLLNGFYLLMREYQKICTQIKIV